MLSGPLRRLQQERAASHRDEGDTSPRNGCCRGTLVAVREHVQNQSWRVLLAVMKSCCHALEIVAESSDVLRTWRRMTFHPFRGRDLSKKRFRAKTSMGAVTWSGFGSGGKHRDSARKHEIYPPPRRPERLFAALRPLRGAHKTRVLDRRLRCGWFPVMRRMSSSHVREHESGDWGGC
jgi:hypothetical protein